MEQKIEIDITNKHYLIDKYNEKKVSHTLIEYIIKHLKQLIFLILGVLFIYLSTLIKTGVVWKEIILITGWVPIWKMIELEILPDVAARRKRRVINKILRSEFVEIDF